MKHVIELGVFQLGDVFLCLSTVLLKGVAVLWKQQRPGLVWLPSLNITLNNLEGVS